MNVQPYLFFEGRCEEALTFYAGAIGAEVTMLMRFSEMPGDGTACLPPGTERKIMHSAMRIGDTEILASDGRCGGAASFQGVSLTMNVADAATAERVFAALAEGGEVRMPLAETFYSPSFGMVADKFGVGWMVVAAPVQASGEAAA